MLDINIQNQVKVKVKNLMEVNNLIINKVEELI